MNDIKETPCMLRWVNLHQNNSFINAPWLPLLCENYGALLLMIVGPHMLSFLKKSNQYTMVLLQGCKNMQGQSEAAL